MIDFSAIAGLLGRSEQSREVRDFLSELGVSQPIPRPKRKEDHINIEVKGYPIELRFSFDEKKSTSEGEMFLDTIFFHRQSFGGGRDAAEISILDININMSRDIVRKKMGPPAWSSPALNNDRWAVDGIRVLICFSNDEKSIRQLVFSKE